MAAGAVGLDCPGRPIGGGADRFLDDIECAAVTHRDLPRVTAVQRLPVTVSPAGRRTLCGIPCDYTHNKLARGELGIAAFFFQPSDDATDDRVQSDHARNRGPRCSANQCLSSDTTGRD